MKRQFLKAIIITAIGVTLLVGCGSNSVTNKGEAKTNETKTEQKQDVKEVKQESKEGNPENTAMANVEDFPLEITIKEPDSIGSRYMDVTFTNNSKYPISYLSARVKFKDDNEPHHITFGDTVMPGEKSPNSEGFAPKSGNKDDIEFLKCEYSIELDGKTQYVEYDYKLQKYTGFVGTE